MRSVGAALLSAVCLLGTSGCGEKPAASDAPAGAGDSARVAQTTSGTADSCAMLTQAVIASAVGNAVQPGRPDAGPEVCKWDTENPDDVSVLLTVRLAGSLRAPILCEEVKKGNSGSPVPGLGDASGWKYSSTLGLFDSGDLEICASGHFVSLSLNGKRAEAAMKDAAAALARATLNQL
jgi:hypothetical protein